MSLTDLKQEIARVGSASENVEQRLSQHASRVEQSLGELAGRLDALSGREGQEANVAMRV